MNRQEAYQYFGGIADIFEYGNESDAECLPTARALIRQTETETDPDILEMIFHALHMLVTYRKTAHLLDFSQIADSWQRFDAMSLEYLPEILAETGDLRFAPLMRQIHEAYPQIEISGALDTLSDRANS